MERNVRECQLPEKADRKTGRNIPNQCTVDIRNPVYMILDIQMRDDN